MKKYFYLSIVIIVLLNFYPLLSQTSQSNQWSDGTPTFTRIESFNNVKIDSVISLQPLFGSSSEPDSFQFILSGLDWSWPSSIPLVAAEDIDYRQFLGSPLYLVTDGAGRRVMEVDPTTPLLTWEFFGNPGTPQYLGNPVDAVSYLENETGESVRKILITDRGRHRVIKVVQQNKAIQWQYGSDVEGNGFNQLSNPTDAVPIPDSGKVFICDRGNNRIILVREADKTILWNWGLGELNSPVDIEYNASTDEVLITDQSNHRVIKVNIQSNAITWQFGIKGQPDSLNNGLNFPSDADFLPNGNILICDAGNNRLIEVNSTGQIVWDFGKRIEGLKDADRLPDNRHLVVSGNLPKRMGYITNTFTSAVKDIGRRVSFDSLFWIADTIAAITSVKIQLRSENTLGDLESAPWRGPTESQAFYLHPGTPINPDHDGHRFYQFKATLETNNPLYTPKLTNVILKYNYYNTRTTGRIVTQTISDSINYIITRWKSLKYNTVLPENTALRSDVEMKVSLLDDATLQSIRGFSASQLDTTNEVALSNIEELKTKQAIKLEVTFKTNNSSVSPKLNNINIDWDRTFSTPSSIQFVGQDLEPVTRYRFSTSYQPGQPYIDRIWLLLDDLNLEQVQNNIQLKIHALKSLDTVAVNLRFQSAANGFVSQSGTIGIIFETGFPNTGNSFLEVFDRDTIVVTYVDPTNPNDVSSDSVLVVQNTFGKIQFENAAGVQIDTVAAKDTVFVRIIEERDRSLTLTQDSISVIVYNNQPYDEELLIMVELPDSNGIFNTGDFLSTHGLPVEFRSSTIGDGTIQTTSTSIISVKYDDSIQQLPLLHVYSGAPAPDTSWNFTGGPLDFDLAPNPYYANRHNLLRIRASSTIGSLYVNKIEIFTLAGEKIRDIQGDRLDFYYNYPIPINQYSFVDNWWDFANSNGNQVSSGTYFIKVIGRISETNTAVSKIKKFVLIR